MKKLALSLAALLSVLGSCKTVEVNRIPTKEQAQIRYIDDLVVNTSDDYRTVIQESEEEGIREMRELVESSALEEAWVYLPDRERWVEVGKRARREKEKGYLVALDAEHLWKLMEENDELVVYHFHPRLSAEKLESLVEERKEDIGEMDEKGVLRFRTELSVRNGLPSGPDLSSMVTYSLKFYGLKPEGKITYKICSAEGVVEFSLAEKGKEAYKGMSSLEYLSLGNFLRRKADNYVLPFFEGGYERSVYFDKFCELLRTVGIEARFIPYEK